MISSMLSVGIANFLMLAIQHGEASTVIPIANMSFVIALLLSVALKMEKLNMNETWRHKLCDRINPVACSKLTLSNCR